MRNHDLHPDTTMNPSRHSPGLITGITLGLLPQFVIIIGIYLFSNAWIALGIEGFLLGSVLVAWIIRGWRPRLGRIPRVTIPFTLMHLASGPVLMLLWRQDPENITTILQRLNVHDSQWPLLIFLHCTAVPLFEELYWRGILFSNSKKPVPADLFFSLYHAGILAVLLPPILWPASLVSLAGAAYIWRRLTILGNGIIPAIILHATADISLLITTYWIVH